MAGVRVQSRPSIIVGEHRCIKLEELALGIQQGREEQERKGWKEEGEGGIVKPGLLEIEIASGFILFMQKVSNGKNNCNDPTQKGKDGKLAYDFGVRMIPHDRGDKQDKEEGNKDKPKYLFWLHSTTKKRRYKRKRRQNRVRGRLYLVCIERCQAQK